MRTIACLAALALLSSTAPAQQQSLFGGGMGGGATAGGGTAGAPQAGGASFEQGGPQITTELGGLSQNAGQAGFLGRNLAGGFLGAGNQNTGATAGAGQTPNFRPGGGGGNANQGGGDAGSGTRRIPRPSYRVGFAYPTRPRAAIDTGLATSFASISTRRPEFRAVRVSVDSRGIARVAGNVPTPSAARLAVAMVRLEPGVRSVEDALVVTNTAPPRP